MEIKKGLLVIVSCLLLTSGCSVVMATQQPGLKDLTVLTRGVERPRVISELGTPLVTEKTQDGNLSDTFSFVQGYHTGVKAGRAVFHAAADVFTCGLWEVVGTPGEAIFSGTKIKTKVDYDKNERIENVIVYEGKDLVDAAIVTPK